MFNENGQNNALVSITKSSLNNKIIMLILALVAVFLVVVLIGKLGGDKSTSSVVSVSGEGQVTVKPDQLSLVVSVVNVDADPAQAIAAGEVATNKLIGISKNLGGNGTEISRTMYQMTPQADGKYLVANAFSVKTSSVGKMSDLIKQLYNSGATAVTGINLGVKSQGDADQKARVAAVKDAEAKALGLVKSAGKGLGRILSISEENSASTAVSTGDSIDLGSSSINVNKKVTIVYEIK